MNEIPKPLDGTNEINILVDKILEVEKRLVQLQNNICTCSFLSRVSQLNEIERLLAIIRGGNK